jgi:glutamate-1-semialdehyde 2,1-aminomutase
MPKMWPGGLQKDDGDSMTGTRRSVRLFKEAIRYLPGGVDSPVRAFRAVGGTPRFIARGAGSRLYDEDGNKLIDYVGSWGPMILGHAHRRVTAGLERAIRSGTSFGACTQLETTLAKVITEAMPSIEMIRFVSSGTEATMTALRLARAFTGKDRIIKFAGCYHGHSDALLVSGGSGMATLGIPDSPGVPASVTQNTLVAPYNNAAAVRELFARYPTEIAAIIVEPVAANMGVVPPAKGFLETLRELCDKHKALLIFDEVITGFRLAFGGAQEKYGVKPDITCLGKVIGGGLPVGAFGGRRDIMAMIAPSGTVYQAGTLSGNPLAMTAGIETLRVLDRGRVYKDLEEKSARLQDGLACEARRAGVPVSISRVGSLLTLFFARGPVTDYESAKASNTNLFGEFFRSLLEGGVYWPPSQFEAAFLGAAHSCNDVEKTVQVAGRALSKLNSAKLRRGNHGAAGND